MLDSRGDNTSDGKAMREKLRQNDSLIETLNKAITTAKSNPKKAALPGLSAISLYVELTIGNPEFLNV